MRKFGITFILLFFALSFLMTDFAVAGIDDAFGETLDTVAGSGGAGYDASSQPEALIGKIIQAAISFVGVVFLVLMIYGGYLWMTAHGNDEQVSKSKKLITAAIIGLIIVFISYAVSTFIIQTVGEDLIAL